MALESLSCGFFFGIFIPILTPLNPIYPSAGSCIQLQNSIYSPQQEEKSQTIPQLIKPTFRISGFSSFFPPFQADIWSNFMKNPIDPNPPFQQSPLEFQTLPALPFPPEKDGNKSWEPAINQKLISLKSPACPDPSNNKTAGIYHGNSSARGGWMREEKQGVKKRGKKPMENTQDVALGWVKCHLPSSHPWDCPPPQILGMMSQNFCCSMELQGINIHGFFRDSAPYREQHREEGKSKILT